MEITQTNINEFYSFVQDQLTKITTKDGLDINIIVKNIMTDLNNLTSYETYESQQCRVHYGRNSIEIRMWIFILICLSWTLLNLTNKVKDGHCQNIDHQHGNQIPRECFDGRKFHYSIYQKCIRSFYDSLTVIEKDLDKYRF